MMNNKPGHFTERLRVGAQSTRCGGAKCRSPYSKQAAAAGESSHPRSGESRIDRMNGGEGEVIHARYDVIQG